MKLLLTLSILTLSCTAFSEVDSRFAEHKKMMVEGLSQQITAMQASKSCMEAAADQEAMKKCHETAKADRAKMEAQRIDENIKKLEEKKKNLEKNK